MGQMKITYFILDSVEISFIHPFTHQKIHYKGELISQWHELKI